MERYRKMLVRKVYITHKRKFQNPLNSYYPMQNGYISNIFKFIIATLNLRREDGGTRCSKVNVSIIYFDFFGATILND